MSRNIAFSFIFIFLMASCVSTKKSVYFRGLEDMSIASKIQSEEPVIRKNDLLSISVSSLNPDASRVFNPPNIAATFTTTVAGTITQSFGYLVDLQGNIQFPILGNIKAEGLTQKALKDTINKQIISRKLLLDPIVSVRYLNFKISVMGEVAHPAVYNVPNERITLLEALSLAGDLTVYAKRNNVLLIREENGKKNLVRLDLSTSQLFYSPYYYLKSNDVIYVEPNRSKIASTRNFPMWLPAVFSITGLGIIVIDRLIGK